MPVTLDASLVVREVIEEARRAAGSGPALAERLQEMGVSPNSGGSYSSSAVSNWILGRVMPPADVLIAAACIAEVSLSQRISTHPTTAAAKPSRFDSVEELRHHVETLQAQMIEAYRLLGAPMPGSISEPTPDSHQPRTG